MGRLGITYEDVANAANELTAKAQAPTIANIRGIIGAGSYSTISTLLKEWKQKPGDQKFGRIEGLPNKLISTVKELWSQLEAETDQRCKDLQEESAATIEKHKSAQLQAENAAKQLTEEKDALTIQLKALNEKYQKTSETLSALQQQSNQQAQQIDHLTDTINTHKNEKTNLNNLIEKLQANLAYFQAETAKERQKEQLQYREEKIQLEIQIKQLNDSLSSNTSMLNSEKNKYQQIHMEYQSLLSQLDTYKAKEAALLITQDNYVQEVKELKAEIKLLSALLKREKGLTKSLQKQNSSLIKKHLLAHSNLLKK
jgi:chromosome segregation ATPase